LLIERPDGHLHVSVDVKVNTVWQRNIVPDEFELCLSAGQFATILIKPHNDEYFAGWGRWFSWWEDDVNELQDDGFRRLKQCLRVRNDMLTAVFSDPDYAHLESETKIGDNFRSVQYYDCPNLKIVPHEDLDCEFEEIGNDFRREQYGGCQLIKKPNETFPMGVKKIGSCFRYRQYDGRFGDEFILSEEKKGALEFILLLLENNPWIFEYISDELKTEEMCKMAVKNDRSMIEFVPKKFMTAEFQKKKEEWANDKGILTQEEIDALLLAVSGPDEETGGVE